MDIRFVQNILENCNDLSVDSPELFNSWNDQQSELLLSSERVNILRALELKPGSNVLQVGCSCGILCRYLTEQGHRVVVIDHDSDLLEMAKLRCRDIQDVHFYLIRNDIQPILQQNYDYILINKALELKSEKNSSSQTNTVQSVQLFIQQLDLLNKALKADGCFIIPAANRLGLKFWLGATEESSGESYLGLQNFGSAQSIAQPHSREEWKMICRDAGITQVRFLYPYPDHLLTELILSEEFIANDPLSHSLLYRIRSRDYLDAGWLPEHDEYLYWKSLHQGGYLGDLSNSFLLIAGNSSQPCKDIFPYDFIKLSKSKQQRQYQTITYKKSGEGIIQKKTISAQTGKSSSSSELFHAPESSEYLQGSLLASLWIDSFIGSQGYDEFISLLKTYNQYLQKQLKESNHPGRLVDLLPFNIIVDSEGHYHGFDQEWQTSEELSSEFVLFRALMWFCFAHDTVIAKKMSEEKITNIADFIDFFFKQLSISISRETLNSKYPEQEARIQQVISDGQGIKQVQTTLRQPFQHCLITHCSILFDTQLFWVTEEEPLSSRNCLKLKGHIGLERQTLFFYLPQHVSSLKTIRFDAADKPGFFHIYRMTLKQIMKEAAEPVIIWEKVGAEEISESVVLDNVHYCSGVMGNVFLATDICPQVIVEFQKEITEKTRYGYLVFEVEIDWPQSNDYMTVAEEINKQNRELIHLNAQNVEYKQHITNLEKHIATLEYKLDLVRKSRLGKLFKSFRV